MMLTKDGNPLFGAFNTASSGRTIPQRIKRELKPESLTEEEKKLNKGNTWLEELESAKPIKRKPAIKAKYRSKHQRTGLKIGGRTKNSLIVSNKQRRAING